MIARWITMGLACGVLPFVLKAQEKTNSPTANDAWNTYFTQVTPHDDLKLEHTVTTKEDWLKNKEEYRRQLAEMLGLDPMPPRTDLKPTKTGEFEHEGIIVEKLHYQSMPGYYVTANLYRPKTVDKPLPAVLYVCGHAKKEKNGIRYGNKAGYEHHGVWYAQHGFVCLVIDTVQLGEIPGEHHGTYSKGRWWWISRGYTPAGVEAWAGMRGLDYLETRPEVDKTRFGVAGRSGGGAYSWWIAALDERVVCAVPTAGITTLHDHVVNGCVSGHCDCMFMVNTYRWDYQQVAALVAPRALLIANTDKDPIFPIDGVFDVFQRTRRIYRLLGAEKQLGLQVAEGGHQDLQTLNTGEFHWMMRHLQGADAMVTTDKPAVKSIEMEQLRVLESVPSDERNTKIDKSFVPMAKAEMPKDEAEWKSMRDGWMKSMDEKVLAGWPRGKLEMHPVNPSDTPQSLKNVALSERGSVFAGNSKASHAITHGVTGRITSEGVIMTRTSLLVDEWADSLQLDLYVVHRESLKPEELDLVVLNVLDDKGWQQFANTYGGKFAALFPAEMSTHPDEAALASELKMHQNFKWGMAYVCPRDIGPTAFKGTPKEITHFKRRFYLLGNTLESMQAWDIRVALRTLRNQPGLKDTKLWLQASRAQGVNALYASLYEDGITRVDLHELPHSHMQPEAPAYLNVLKYIDVPQVAALAAERTRVIIYDDNQAAWQFPVQTAERMGWTKEKGNGFQLRETQKGKP